MRLLLRLVGDTRAAAAVEMALVTPMLALIMLGSGELGRFFYNEHIVIKAVRDGAVYAARQSIDKFNCSASPPSIDGTVIANTTALIQTGALSGGTALTPQAANAAATYTMTLTCPTAAPDGTTLGGIYANNGGKVPVLTINASVPYNTIMKGYGFGTTITLHATQQAIVTAA